MARGKGWKRSRSSKPKRSTTTTLLTRHESDAAGVDEEDKEFWGHDEEDVKDNEDAILTYPPEMQPRLAAWVAKTQSSEPQMVPEVIQLEKSWIQLLKKKRLDELQICMVQLKVLMMMCLKDSADYKRSRVTFYKMSMSRRANGTNSAPLKLDRRLVVVLENPSEVGAAVEAAVHEYPSSSINPNTVMFAACSELYPVTPPAPSRRTLP